MPGTNGNLTAAELAQIAAALQAQAAVRQQLRRTAVAGALAPFQALRDWWNTVAVGRAILAALRIVQPAQLQAARTTDAYLARVLSIMTGRTVRPVGAVDIRRLRRALPAPALARTPTTRPLPEPGPGEPPRVDRREDHDDLPDVVLPQRPPGEQLPANLVVDPIDVYGRIAETYRKSTVIDGYDEQRAARRAFRRVQIVAETDILLAIREQVRRVMGRRTDVDGYRRIVRPELSESGPCGLCIVASDRIYDSDELMPIHALCVCAVLPVIGDLDPGLVLNGRDLRTLYGEAGGTSRRGLSLIRVDVVEHGELGAVLVDGKHQFRGPRQTAAVNDPNPRRRAEVELEWLEEGLGALRAREARGERVQRSIDWHETKIRDARSKL